jgi:hypothetical protein
MVADITITVMSAGIAASFTIRREVKTPTALGICCARCPTLPAPAIRTWRHEDGVVVDEATALLDSDVPTRAARSALVSLR